jgi:PAS domain S-box-containing protein
MPAPARSHWLSSRGAALLAAALMIALLASTSWLLQREFARSEQLQEAVRQSFDRRARLQTVLSLHQDIETGQRGFVLTANPEFLEPYSRAKLRVRDSLATLPTPSAGGGISRAQRNRLQALSAAKLAFADEGIELQRRGKGRSAVAMIAEGQGKRIMDEIRSVIAAADLAEQRQLEHRLRQSQGTAHKAQLMSAALQCVLLMLLAFAAWLVGRSLAERKLALRRSEDLAARQIAIFNSAKDGIIVINASGSIESLNPAAARLYGFAQDELVRRDVGILFEVAPDQGKVETFLKRLERRAGAGNDASHEFWGRRKDGKVFPCDVTLSPVSISGGPRYVAIVRDISERKQVDQMKTEFVATVSHELRTPLTSIGGSLGLLAGGAAGALPGPAARLVEIAANNCERLVRLINDILDVEKIESGEMRLNILPITLQPFLAQVVDANIGFAQKHEVRLGLGTVDASAAIMADSDALTQVFTNLISNAVKFSPPGSVVRLDVSSLDRRHRISVWDRGNGIPEEFRGRIFGKFAQADSTDTRRIGGTGLGLNIVKGIVTRLGGTVDFESRAGGGTVFHVDIPAAPPVEIAQSAQHDEAGDLPLVLHVDDDPDVLRVIAEAFSGTAIVRSATSLAAARLFLQRSRPKAVLLDAALPDGSGLDLIAEFDGRADRPALIVFSAQDVDPRGLIGADAVLVKARASLAQLVGTTLDLIHKTQRKAA